MVVMRRKQAIRLGRPGADLVSHAGAALRVPPVEGPAVAAELVDALLLVAPRALLGQLGVLRMLRAALLPPSSLLCRRAGLALHMAATRAQYATLT